MQIIVTQQGTHEVDVKCLNVFASTLIWNPFDFSWNISREGRKDGSDKNGTKMTGEWPKNTKRTRKRHKNDSKVTQKWLESDTQMTGGTCREGCGPCGGSRGGPEEQGKHLHWENIGKHLEMHQHQGRFQFHTYPNVLDICYVFVGQWLFTFCAVQCQVRLVRMRGNVNKIPSKLTLKKLM